MKFTCALIFALVAAATAHYSGYPFVHRNEGRYGAAYPYANHAEAAPAPAPAVGFGNGYGYGFGNEFTYRGYGAYPIHLGNGHFQYLGKFNGDCTQAGNSGFYFAGDSNSYVVCDNGRAHRFACPAGTANRDSDYFEDKRAYGLHEFCSVNTNQ